MKALTYRGLLRQEPEDGFTVTVPALPGCITHGESVDEALSMTRDAIEAYIAELKDSGKEIPEDEKFAAYSVSVWLYLKR